MNVYIYTYTSSTHMHTHSGKLLSHKNEQNLAISGNMDGIWWYYAKGNEVDREKQILFDFSDMQHLKKKAQTKLMDT